MKNIYFLTVVLLAQLFTIQSTIAQPASLCCPFNGWDYVVRITVSNSTGANIPAQSTLFVINTAVPIGAGKMQANGNDIRFVYNTCGNYRNYWIESGINTANTHIWVALPGIPNGGSITLYMYYGNPGAAAGASAQTVLFPNIQTITGTQALSGTITADWIEVNGATINAPTGAPLVLRARRIIYNGTYNADNRGYGPQAGPGAGTNGGGSKGGSGGSYGGVGGSGGGSVSSAYGTPNGADIDMGSGGGGSDCGPTAAGGGAISLIGSSVDVNGTINVRGQNAQNCCCGNSSEAAGGGSGGGVLLEGDYIRGSATIRASGGNGGDSDDKEGGGGGAGGRVKLRWCKANTFAGTVNVNGGSPGSGGQSGMQSGATGTNTQPQTTCDAIVISPEQPVSIPTASFTYNNACTGVITTFASTTTLVSGGSVSTYAWDFGDGGTANTQNPTHSFTSTGNFNVSLTVTSVTGCTDAVTVPITVQQLPVADFTANVACAGTNTNFTDASTGGVVGWNWDFGDGSSDTVQNPLHAYAAGGSYTATLIAINSGNCSDTIQKPVTVNTSPTASFTTANVCYPSAVQFNNTSTGAIASTGWGFGDTQFSTQQSPSHTYASAGTYNVVLVVATADNCADTAIQTVTVNPKPVADFSVSPVCEGITSSFTDASTGNIINYGWSFGDGNFSTQQNPSNTYTGANTYNVTLVVQTDSSCYDTVTKQAVVNPLPVVDFNTGAVCLNQSNAFVNTTTIASGSVSVWAWDFGDTQTSSQQSPTHAYSAQGTYTVSLIATSDNNCVDSTSKQVDVFDKPSASFTVTEVCFGVSNVFTDGSSISTGAIVQWSYSFGDGQTGTSANDMHTYSAAGNFTAVLVVTSDNGCTDTATQTAIVDPLPQVNFTAPDVCLNNTTQFTNASTISSGTITNYQWDFGDANSSTAQSPSNTYATTGTFQVTLVETSDKGCLDSLLKSVTVFDVPVVVTSSTPACYAEANGTATVIASAGTPSYSYVWSNGQTSATATLLSAGNYGVTVTDANNCTVSSVANVTEPASALTVVATPAAPSIAIGDMVSITLSNSYNDASAVYSTTPSYGLSCTDCAQMDALPYQTTEYEVLVTDANGCEGSGRFTITVDQSIPVFIPNAFSPNGDGSNDTWGVYSRAIKQLSLSVFNRWGEKVFETDNMNELWDGTYHGNPAPEGVYVYKGYIVYLNDKTRQVKGGVTIIR